MISSTWRLFSDYNECLRDTLTKLGIEIVGETPDLGIKANFEKKGHRVAEIQKWLSENPTDQWIAIDDLDLTQMCSSGINEDYFVHTDETVGLTQEKTAEAIKKLTATCKMPLSKESKANQLETLLEAIEESD